jgi:hypothetical protein
MFLVALPCKSEHAKVEEGEITSLIMKEFSERRIVAPGLFLFGPVETTSGTDQSRRSSQPTIPSKFARSWELR